MDILSVRSYKYYFKKMSMLRDLLNLLAPLSILLVLAATVEAYKVLVVFPLPGKSHSILGDGYVRELLKKGHEVTYITPFPKDNAQANLTQIDVSFTAELMPLDVSNVSRILEQDTEGPGDIKMMLDAINSMMEAVLRHERVQDLLQDTNQKFDLVVLEWFFTELFTGLSAVYQCPLIWSLGMEANSLMLRLVDEEPNPLLSTSPMNFYTAPYTFYQRVELLFSSLFFLYMAESFTPARTKAYSEIYPPLLHQRGLIVPSYEDVLYNGSMLLTNSHPSIGGAPKLAQNIINVGGYHIDNPTKPLPSDLQKIMDESKHGVIYFSLGSNAKSKDLPDKLKTDLLKMFGGLKQTVFWKFEEELPNVPKNVHIHKWMPQPSILAHPNLKIFITHGGLLSTTEAVHYGVPIIGVPLFGDQHMNMKRSADKGFAITVKLTYNLPDDLNAAIDTVLKDPNYATTVKRLSSLFHDRPLPPTEELVYWLEYAVRTGGAPHLRSPALLLPWYQRLYVDLLALIAVTLLGLLLLVKYIIRIIRSKPQDQKKKKN